MLADPAALKLVSFTNLSVLGIPALHPRYLQAWLHPGEMQSLTRLPHTRCPVGVCLGMWQASPNAISSCLVEDRRGMKRAMLEVVAAGVVATSDDVERYLKCRCVRRCVCVC